MTDAFQKMDKMYRHQRYFYDFTRKYYLLGRDQLIGKLNVKSGENILEIGCGTARNLMILARKYQAANFYGLDASAAMLETARKKIEARNIENITLKNVLAGDFNYQKTFELTEPFDTIYFSYSITMIPNWKEAIANALENLKSKRSFYIVDFYDQRDLSAPFRKVLQSWLKMFDVIYPKDLMPHLESLERLSSGKLSVTSIYKSYAFIAEFEKNG
ncbi:MAG: L-histidine N(alpha)-methyltransferase [Acidobacteriota bacterium]